MPPIAAVAGIAAAGMIASKGAQAAVASGRAKDAKKSAQEWLDTAMKDKPGTVGFGQGTQDQLMSTLAQYGLQGPKSLEQQYFSPELEQEKIGQVTEDVSKFSDRLQMQLAEQQASRGLRRSGIGAQQSAQAGAELAGKLGSNITNLRLGFQQNRMQEEQNRFKLNLLSQQLQHGMLTSAVQQQNVAQRQQAGIWGEMMVNARQAAQGAGAAQQRADQAWGGFTDSFGQAASMGMQGMSLWGGGGGGFQGMTGSAPMSAPAMQNAMYPNYTTGANLNF